MLPVDLVEPGEVLLLAPEQLHGRHPRDPLLEEGIDPRDPRAHVPIGVPDVAAEPLGDQRHERKHGERDEREAPVHHREDHHDPQEREDVAEDGDDAGREEVVEDVHVRRDACHHPPDRVPVVVAQVQPLQVRVHLHAHVEHDALPGQLQGPGLDVLRREGAGEGGEIEQGDDAESRDVAGRDVGVDDELRQVRRRELRRRVGHDGSHRHGDLPAVRAEVAEQPAHQPRVVGLPEDLLFVDRHQEAASSSSSSWRRWRSA